MNARMRECINLSTEDPGKFAPGGQTAYRDYKVCVTRFLKSHLLFQGSWCPFETLGDLLFNLDKKCTPSPGWLGRSRGVEDTQRAHWRAD